VELLRHLRYRQQTIFERHARNDSQSRTSFPLQSERLDSRGSCPSSAVNALWVLSS
jgi:hypothetical protein